MTPRATPQETRAAIYEAFQARRFYSTLDKNPVLSLTINGQPWTQSLAPEPTK